MARFHFHQPITHCQHRCYNNALKILANVPSFLWRALVSSMAPDSFSTKDRVFTMTSKPLHIYLIHSILFIRLHKRWLPWCASDTLGPHPGRCFQMPATFTIKILFKIYTPNVTFSAPFLIKMLYVIQQPSFLNSAIIFPAFLFAFPHKCSLYLKYWMFSLCDLILPFSNYSATTPLW